MSTQSESYEVIDVSYSSDEEQEQEEQIDNNASIQFLRSTTAPTPQTLNDATSDSPTYTAVDSPSQIPDWNSNPSNPSQQPDWPIEMPPLELPSPPLPPLLSPSSSFVRTTSSSASIVPLQQRRGFALDQPNHLSLSSSSVSIPPPSPLTRQTRRRQTMQGSVGLTAVAPSFGPRPNPMSPPSPMTSLHESSISSSRPLHIPPAAPTIVNRAIKRPAALLPSVEEDEKKQFHSYFHDSTKRYPNKPPSIGERHQVTELPLPTRQLPGYDEFDSDPVFYSVPSAPIPLRNPDTNLPMYDSFLHFALSGEFCMICLNRFSDRINRTSSSTSMSRSIEASYRNRSKRSKTLKSELIGIPTSLRPPFAVCYDCLNTRTRETGRSKTNIIYDVMVRQSELIKHNEMVEEMEKLQFDREQQDLYDVQQGWADAHHEQNFD